MLVNTTLATAAATTMTPMTSTIQLIAVMTIVVYDYGCFNAHKRKERRRAYITQQTLNIEEKSA